MKPSRRARIAFISIVGMLALLTSATLLPIGCGSARRSVPLVGPMELDDPQLILGQQVFASHCYQCHPGGRAGLGPAINDKPLPAALIRMQVRNGLGAMPAFGEPVISDEQLDAVAQYLVALRDHNSAEDSP